MLDGSRWIRPPASALAWSHSRKSRRGGRTHWVAVALERGEHGEPPTLLALLPPLGDATVQVALAAARLDGPCERALRVASAPVTIRLVVKAPCRVAWRGSRLDGWKQMATSARERAFMGSRRLYPARRARALGCARAGCGASTAGRRPFCLCSSRSAAQPRKSYLRQRARICLARSVHERRELPLTSSAACGPQS